MSDRRLPPAVALTVVAALLAGCSSLPTSGPVRPGRDLQADRDDVGVRVIGQPPLPGAPPEDIVRGFLQAGADFVNDHAVARLYLAPKARQQWKPNTGTSVYDRSEGPFSVEPAGSGQVTLTATHVAGIDGQGHYTRTAAGSPRLTRTFEMTQVDGEWRIAALDNGLVLTRSDVQETFRQLNLYFLAPSRRVLVPDTVFLPAVPGLSTALVTRLLAGPGEALASATTTAFPRGSSLAVSSVPLRDGIAQVNLDDTVGRADDSARALMSAQLVWTLKQLPEFRGLQLSVEGVDLGVPGQGEVQPSEAWSDYDPAGVPRDAVAYAVRGGRLGRILDGRFTDAGAPGDRRLALRRPAVSLDGAQVAGVTNAGRALVTGRLVDEEPLRVRLRGSALTTPSWDAAGNVWVVDAPVGRLWMIPDGTRAPVAVKVPELPAGRVIAVKVARDGARVAVVAGDGAGARLYVGSIERGRSGAPTAGLAGLTEVLPELRSVRDVAWADATTLAVLGAQGGELVAPFMTDTDGYEVVPVEPQVGLVSIAAAPPARPLLAGSENGRIAQYTAGRGWVDLGPGATPAYPG